MGGCGDGGPVREFDSFPNLPQLWSHDRAGSPRALVAGALGARSTMMGNGTRQLL